MPGENPRLSAECLQTFFHTSVALGSSNIEKVPAENRTRKHYTLNKFGESTNYINLILCVRNSLVCFACYCNIFYLHVVDAPGVLKYIVQRKY